MQYNDPVAGNVDLGDREVAQRGEILRTEVGSGVHGMAIAGTDDHDEMAVYLERPEQLLGTAANAAHWIWRTQPMGARSGPGDVDLTSYSLRKYIRLALGGNPTVLLPLYAEGDAVMFCNELGAELQALAPSIVSARVGRRFLGYLDNQRRRLLQGNGHRVPNRPELVARHGYDTKYASHGLRLAHQGVEIMSTGRLVLPLRGEALAECVAVKRGDVDFATALGMIDRRRQDLERLVTSGGVLPAEPDLAALDGWILRAYRSYWGWEG